MALSYYIAEPFTAFKEFDRLFDEAFASRAANGQVQSQDQSNTAKRPLRPRYVLAVVIMQRRSSDRPISELTFTKTQRRTWSQPLSSSPA